MNDDQQACAYAYADFSAAHDHFIELFQQKFPDLHISDAVLDLGCGPADISRRFARAYPQCHIHGVDGASAMLKYGQQLNQQTEFSDRIQLIEASLPAASLPQNFYHVMISNSLLHHLHDPFVLWNTLQQQAKPFASIFIMDLMRPESEETAKQLTQHYTVDEPEILQNDFFNSLCAAFTPDEVQQQLDEMAMYNMKIETASDRHMIIYGQLS